MPVLPRHPQFRRPPPAGSHLMEVPRFPLPAGSPGRRHPECRARERRLPSSRHHEPAPSWLTLGATDNEHAKYRSCGRSVASFYNIERPHQRRGMNGRTPAEVFLSRLPKPKTPKDEKMKKAAHPPTWRELKLSGKYPICIT